jgi:hypothetical protein
MDAGGVNHDTSTTNLRRRNNTIDRRGNKGVKKQNMPSLRGEKENKMGKNPIVDMEKALAEKEQMQKIFVREHDYPSSVLTLLIAYFKGQIRKK